ncbi:hypothetical protein E2C01_023301 [Portunus trituberculatus]|uniref:Uncharacterized protein n=1 Tax=Portunus trituberculatus TaxID=210409 RepID=A0A5B7E9L9_PORTR|nr:hypothetical protein [Portunus trituberculatus]
MENTRHGGTKSQEESTALLKDDSKRSHGQSMGFRSNPPKQPSQPPVSPRDPSLASATLTEHKRPSPFIFQPPECLSSHGVQQPSAPRRGNPSSSTASSLWHNTRSYKLQPVPHPPLSIDSSPKTTFSRPLCLLPRQRRQRRERHITSEEKTVILRSPSPSPPKHTLVLRACRHILSPPRKLISRSLIVSRITYLRTVSHGKFPPRLRGDCIMPSNFWLVSINHAQELYKRHVSLPCSSPPRVIESFSKGRHSSVPAWMLRQATH